MLAFSLNYFNFYAIIDGRIERKLEILHLRRGIMKTLIAPGIYSCRKHRYKHRTVERFYLEFASCQGGNMPRDTAETIEHLGNVFFSGQYFKGDRIVSFRLSKQGDGFYLTIGKVRSCQRIVDIVRDLCGYIVGTDEIKPTDSLMKPDLSGAKIFAADYHILLHKPVRL